MLLHEDLKKCLREGEGRDDGWIFNNREKLVITNLANFLAKIQPKSEETIVQSHYNINFPQNWEVMPSNECFNFHVRYQWVENKEKWKYWKKSYVKQGYQNEKNFDPNVSVSFFFWENFLIFCCFSFENIWLFGGLVQLLSNNKLVNHLDKSSIGLIFLATEWRVRQ